MYEFQDKTASATPKTNPRLRKALSTDIIDPLWFGTCSSTKLCDPAIFIERAQAQPVHKATETNTFATK